MRYSKLTDQIKGADCKSFENNVKKNYEKNYPGVLVVRFDHKNKMPDWLVSDPMYGVIAVECKSYKSMKGIERAIEKWKDNQPEQYHSFMRLKRSGMKVNVVFNLKDGTWVVNL